MDYQNYNPRLAALTEARTLLTDAVQAAMADGTLPQADLPDFIVEIPADVKNGDVASNLAMAGARAFHKAPRQIAEAITAKLDLNGTLFAGVDIAGPGFINLFLGQEWFTSILRAACTNPEYGRTDAGAGKRYNVEFVSANPTGPMHMGNARGGAIGDCLAAVMDFAGYEVTREFYINDAGNQIEKFGLSLEVRYLQLFLGDQAPEMPEDAYHGDDIREHARHYADEHGDTLVALPSDQRRKALVAYALPLNIEKMKADLLKYRIEYDQWFRESSLHDDGEVREVLDLLGQKGLTYEKDGALWYKASENGGEKDEVLVRANGTPTYFAADIAYHRNKFRRGFDTCIDVWGADHHGHVARMKGAMDAVGLDGSKLQVVLIQLVRLMRDGEVVRMSKRSGKAIQLADLLDEVPVDAARFFFNLREANSRMDFDLDLAVEQSASNPVYYVQYAHARICSLFRNLQSEGVTLRPCSPEELSLLSAPEEKELIRHLAAYPGEIVAAAKDYDPARMTRYCMDLASLFHKFYNACRVKGEEERLLQARLSLCAAARYTLKNALILLKIDAPESM